MLAYILLNIIWITAAFSNPIQTQQSKSAPPLFFFSPPASQYVPQNLFLQYPEENAAYGKALQSIQSPNELLFYPPSTPVAPQSAFLNAQPGNVGATAKFTAPPSGLVNAIYAWFAENNIPVPDDPSKNFASDAPSENFEIAKDQGKTENADKPATAGEAEILAEAEKNPNFHYPKKPITPKFNPGQRFYILNGQPQFFGNYQPIVSRFQPVIPQLFTRNAVSPDPQNILILHPHSEIQQSNIKLKNTLPVQQEQNAQNVLLLRNNLGNDQNNIQPEILKPVRYHSQDLKPQNFVLVRESQSQNEASQLQVQPLVQTYSRQQVLIGRLLPQSHDIKQQQISQNPIHQTHYVPVEVVPPQFPQQQTAHLQYHNEQIPQQDINPQQLSFIHIPVDRNIQPPQYIKSIVPLQLNSKNENSDKLPVIPLRNQHQQQPTSGQQILYLSEVQQPINNEKQIQDSISAEIEAQQQQQQQQQQQLQEENSQQEQSQTNNDVPPGVAALEFARYIASRHGDLYSDTVVIDAKTDEPKQQETESDDAQADNHEEPSLAQAHPSGIALAGTGGVASTAPRATALVGDRGLAVASPHATAVSGPDTEKSNKDNKQRS